MSLTIGIVGLPNVGKSTMFNALTKNDVLAANYPFATIEPNVGVVGLPDPRLDVLAEMFGSREDRARAGVVRRHRRHRPRRVARAQGRGNKFLANIREASTRSARSCGRSPTRRACTSTARSTPADDIETIDTELILADLQTVEKAMPAPGEGGAAQEGQAAAVDAAAQAAFAAQRRHHALPGAAAAGIDIALLRELHLLTIKPFLYVFNVDEDELSNDAFLDELRALVAPAEASSWTRKIESELIDLPTTRRWSCSSRPARPSPASTS